MKNFLWLYFLCNVLCAQSPPYTFSLQYQEQGLSLRGLSVPNEAVAWASGTNGRVLRTTDGGKHWRASTIIGYEKYDFRDIHAFDSLRAVVMNVASPAYILRTDDGGRTWKQVYANTNPDAFLDDIAFEGENGYAFGDTDQAGRFLALLTTDGGHTWRAMPTLFPVPDGKEAGFAASGSILHHKAGKIWLATGGGSTSHLYFSPDAGKTWQTYTTPILAGTEARGIFSLALGKNKNLVAVGGDYGQADKVDSTAVYSQDAGKTWCISAKPPRGYRAGVAHAVGKIFVCVGTNGVDYTLDAGKIWLPLASYNLNAIRFSAKGARGWAVGKDGQIFCLTKNK